MNECKIITNCIHSVLQVCLLLSPQSRISEELVLSNRRSECHIFPAYVGGLQDANSDLWWKHPCMCHYKLKNTLVSYNHTPKLCCTVLLCVLANMHRLYILPSTSPAKPIDTRKCSLHRHITVATTHSLSYPGSKECILQQNFRKMMTHNHSLFLISVTRTEYCHSGVFSHIKTPHSPWQDCSPKRCDLKWVTHLSTSKFVERCHPSSIFIQQYAWGSKIVSLASSCFKGMIES